MKSKFRVIRYGIEAGLLLSLMLLFRLLPLDAASSLGGVLARIIGPFLRAHRVADANLRRVFPQYSERERSRVLSAMWDNLGRVAGEYPHLSLKVMRKRITVEGGEYLEQVRDTHTSMMFVSGHFANWEMAPLVGVMYQLPLVFIYRAANNPYAEAVIQWMRRDYRHLMYGKGRESVQHLLRALQRKQCTAMLVDQKLSEGVDVPFFGYPAKTTPSAAKLAHKFHTPMIALRIVRTDGAHFHVTVTPPMECDPDPVVQMTRIHQLFESWIREKPEQWFWVHNRWNWRETDKGTVSQQG